MVFDRMDESQVSDTLTQNEDLLRAHNIIPDYAKTTRAWSNSQSSGFVAVDFSNEWYYATVSIAGNRLTLTVERFPTEPTHLYDRAVAWTAWKADGGFLPPPEVNFGTPQIETTTEGSPT